MSERVYGWLLRLYPSSFRQAYGEEAMQLFRDRWRDERAPLARVRLWRDVLADVALSAPREWRYGSAAVVVAQGQLAWDGFPSFRVLDAETLDFRSLFRGGVAAVVVYGSLLVLAGRETHGFPLPAHEEDAAVRYAAAGTGALLSPAPDGRMAGRAATVMPSQSATGVAAASMAERAAPVLAVQIRPGPIGDPRFFGALRSLAGSNLSLGTVTTPGGVPKVGTRDIKGVSIGGAVGSMSGGKREAVHEPVQKQDALGVSSRPRAESVARDNHRTVVRRLRHRARARHRVHSRRATPGRGQKAAHIRGRIYKA